MARGVLRRQIIAISNAATQTLPQLKRISPDPHSLTRSQSVGRQVDYKAIHPLCAVCVCVRARGVWPMQRRFGKIITKMIETKKRDTPRAFNVRVRVRVILYEKDQDTAAAYLWRDYGFRWKIQKKRKQINISRKNRGFWEKLKPSCLRSHPPFSTPLDRPGPALEVLYIFEYPIFATLWLYRCGRLSEKCLQCHIGHSIRKKSLNYVAHLRCASNTRTYFVNKFAANPSPDLQLWNTNCNLGAFEIPCCFVIPN